MPELPEIIWMAFMGLFSFISGYAVKELKALTASVNDLNLKLGQVLITQNWHKEAIQKNDIRITRLEDKK